MIKQAFVICVAISFGPYVWAVNKCTGADGKIAFQDAPCAASQQTQEVKGIHTNGTTSSSSAAQLRYKIAPISPDDAKSKAVSDLAIAKASLKDPDSAKFKEVSVFSFMALGKPFVMTCGVLNAKNSFGGYVDDKRFWVYNGVFTETWNHFLAGTDYQWLMGDVQNSCFKEGIAISTQ